MGQVQLLSIRFIITKRKNSNNDVFRTGDVIIPAGITVNSDFTYTYTETVNGALPGTEKTITNVQAVDSVTNYQYEWDENQNRAEIVLLRKNLLEDFVSEFENLVIQKR